LEVFIVRTFLYNITMYKIKYITQKYLQRVWFPIYSSTDGIRKKLYPFKIS